VVYDCVQSLLLVFSPHACANTSLHHTTPPYSAGILSASDMEAAFRVLLDDLYELKLDTPDAADALAKFIARAVADECLPPAYAPPPSFPLPLSSPFRPPNKCKR